MHVIANSSLNIQHALIRLILLSCFNNLISFSNKGMLPVRWMALESLEDYTYNTKTDV